MKPLNTVLIAGLALSVASLSACASSVKPRDASANASSTQATAGSDKLADSALVPIHRGPGEGKDYQWGKDHIFVKLTRAETGGALTLIQDNLKAGFDLGLHLHRTHTEIFYILEGEVKFTIGQERLTATTGSVVYIPAGMPHAATSSTGGRMLMFYAPGGFDEMLVAIENASWFQRLNPFATARRNEKYDNHKTSDGTLSDQNEPKPLYLAPGAGKSNEQESGQRIVKLSNVQTGGLATVIEESLNPGSKREWSLQRNQAQIMYVLDGEVRFQIADKTRTATTGSTLFFPAGVRPTVTSSAGAKLLVYRTPG